MFKKKVLVPILSCLLVFLIVLLFQEEDNHRMFTRMIAITDNKASSYINDDMKIIEVDINEIENDENYKKESEEADNVDNMSNEVESEVVEVAAEVVVPEKVYEGMTMDELASKLERSLKNELSGKGYLYASYSLEKGVDPYLAVAISLEETGCNWNCSNLVRSCNNVGGMKGSGCGSYGYFPTLDDGIRAFIDNIYKNYVACGLTTADTMNPKYAENPMWSTNVNNYITRIKNA